MKNYRIFKKVDEVYDAMLEACRGAKREILFEQYIFGDFGEGKVGGEFLKVFLAKARVGVRVVLHLDAVGSFRLFRSDVLRKELVEAGVELSFYKLLPLKIFVHLARWILRNHKKLMIVDQEEVWVGGVVFGERYRMWDDLMVRYRDKGIGEKLRRCFFAQLDKSRGWSRRRFNAFSLDNETKLLSNGPGFKNRFVSKQMHRRVRGAKKSVVIVTPYFAPPLPMWIELRLAVMRGVKVTLILPKDTDHDFINLVHRGYFKKLVKLGVRIFLHEKMLHAKLLMVDGKWATFGSTNFDNMSLLYHHELNVATTERGLVRDLGVYVEGLVEESVLVKERDLDFGVFGWVRIYFYRLLRFIT